MKEDRKEELGNITIERKILEELKKLSDKIEKLEPQTYPCYPNIPLCPFSCPYEPYLNPNPNPYPYITYTLDSIG